MLNISSIPARNLQKSYKSIIEAVKTKKSPVILTTQSVPQAAIVSLEDLEALSNLRAKNSGKALLEISKKVHEILKDEKLPKDLAENHDHYAWGAEKRSP